MGSSNSKIDNTPNAYNKSDTYDRTAMSHINNVNRDGYVYEAHNSVYFDKLDTNLKKKFDVFVDQRGVSMPYMSEDSSERNESNHSEDADTIKFIEFRVCRDNISNITQKYAINLDTPNHDCGANCKCIEGSMKIISDKKGNKKIILDDKTRNQLKNDNHLKKIFEDSENLFKSLSDKNKITYSDTSPEPEGYLGDKKMDGGYKKKGG